MTNITQQSYDWEIFLETQSLESIDNFINHMVQAYPNSVNFENWLESALAVRSQRADLKIPPIKDIIVYDYDNIPKRIT